MLTVLLFIKLDKKGLRLLSKGISDVEPLFSKIAEAFYFLLENDDHKATIILQEVVQNAKKSFFNKAWFKRSLLQLIMIILFQKYDIRDELNQILKLANADSSINGEIFNNLIKKIKTKFQFFSNLYLFGDIFTGFYYALLIGDENKFMSYGFEDLLGYPYLNGEFINSRELNKSGKIKSEFFSVIEQLHNFKFPNQYINEEVLKLIDIKDDNDKIVWVKDLETKEIIPHKIAKTKRGVSFKKIYLEKIHKEHYHTEDGMLASLLISRNFYAFFKLLSQYDKFYVKKSRKNFYKAKLIEGFPFTVITRDGEGGKIMFYNGYFYNHVILENLYGYNYIFYSLPSYLKNLEKLISKCDDIFYFFKSDDFNLIYQIANKLSLRFKINFEFLPDSNLLDFDEEISSCKSLKVMVDKFDNKFVISFMYAPIEEIKLFTEIKYVATMFFYNNRKYFVTLDEKLKSEIEKLVGKYGKKGKLEFDKIEELLKFLAEIKQVDGVSIEVSSELFLKDVYKVKKDNFELKESASGSYFEIDGSVKLQDKVIKFLDLVRAISEEKNDTGFVQLKNGDYLLLDDKVYDELRQLSIIGKTKKGKFLIHKKLRPFVSSNKASLLEKNLLAEKIDEINEKIYAIPDGFCGVLRGYQVEAFNWMNRMFELNFGVCLADDMGLGKTVTSIVFMESVIGNTPFLVVAPASLIHNWAREVKKFSKNLNPVIVNNLKTFDAKNCKGNDVVIVSYGLLLNRFKVFEDTKFNVAFFDEGHLLKNPAAKRSIIAKRIIAHQKIVLTGTPIENNLSELWNIMDIVNEGILGSYNTFKEKFLSADINSNQLKLLKKVIQPFVLRRKKGDVLKELPKKTEVIIDYELREDEISFYQALQLHAKEKLMQIDNVTKNAMSILSEIVKLKMACCHPKLIDEDVTINESSKERVFFEIVEEIIEGGHKVLVFSQFVKFLKIIEKGLKNRNINYAYLDGNTPVKERKKIIESFQEDKNIKIFLLSLKAGGLGLNLTAADIVIHLDPWWNPAAEEQASDRAYRIGQVKPVTVYKLIAKNTLEERILEIQSKKRELADFMLENTDKITKLSINELIALLS
ncbi:DEAD/DEAH box helicase [Deferribacter autotrophicus]|uniref:DEAD/DEAH box helicase n=1 Tax=Deferribacter autotrophicus TaxID=500465 RepID=A0A5A8F567_9BACT|nr:DEAD/DEAH box helicase [Deferribacter autotrophicus]KAA0258830.1 DEAD/DEAH box helicase [Deferribacter autotrophicus]